MTHSAETSLGSKGRARAERSPGKNAQHDGDGGVVSESMATRTSKLPPAPTTPSEAAATGTSSDATRPFGLAPVFFFTAVVIAIIATGGGSCKQLWDVASIPWSTGPNHDASSDVNELALTSETDAVVQVSLESNQDPASTSSSWQNARMREADVVTMSSPHDDYAIYARAEVPIILKESLVTTWAAFDKWTPEYIASALPVANAYVRPAPSDPGNILPARRAPSEFITWHDNKPLEGFVAPEAGSWAAFNTMMNVSTLSLFNKGPPYLYYSQDIAKLQETFPSAVRDLQPLRPLATADTGLQVNLWLGAEPVQTYMHYDASYNFFAQLHGRKKFTLFPPNTSMYPWPCLHSHIGHAQVDWRPDADVHVLRRQFPQFSPREIVIAEVGRGDMLVLPPYWWHHVETVESPSVSVNMWSDAPAYDALEDAYAIPVPIDEDWTLTRRVATASDFLGLVVADVLAQVPSLATGGVAGFARDLYHQRWERIVSAGHVASGKLDLQALCGSTAVAHAAESDRSKLESRAEQVKPFFAKMQPGAVRLLSLGNYVEHVAAAAVGPESAGEFIRECLVRTRVADAP